MQSRPAADVLADALPNTLLLMGTALVLSFAFGVALGAWQASRAGSRSDKIVGTTSLIVASLPEFWLGLVLMLLLALRFPILPAGGAVDLAEVVVEAAASFGWERWAGPGGAIVGLDHFGASAPAPRLFHEFGFTAERVADVARSVISRGCVRSEVSAGGAGSAPSHRGGGGHAGSPGIRAPGR